MSYNIFSIKKRGAYLLNIKMERHFYKNFGECLKLTNGLVEAIVTIDFGPRIIYFGLPNGENLFNEDTNRDGSVSGSIIDAVYGSGSNWFSYGGHRLWLSPEDMPLTYYPDNERVIFNEIPFGVELIPPAQRVTDFQYRIEIIFSTDKPQISVKHFITNIGETTKRRAAWAISVLSQGGLEVIPQPLGDTGLLANRVMSLWSYADMSDERVYWGKRYITLRQNPANENKFKFGINNLRGWAAYFNHGGLFIKKYVNNPSGIYPDYGTSFETYTDKNFLEMESLSELIDITPHSTIFHGEEWTLIKDVARPAPNDEDAIDKIVKQYIEN